MCWIAEALEKEGIRKGRKESRLDLLRNMLAQDFTEETILKLGFTENEIRTVQVKRS